MRRFNNTPPTTIHHDSSPPSGKLGHCPPLRSQDFRLLVIEKLSRLETMVADLVGNGQPGRIQRLEEKVRLHDRLIWMATGAGMFLGWVIQKLLQ